MNGLIAPALAPLLSLQLLASGTPATAPVAAVPAVAGPCGAPAPQLPDVWGVADETTPPAPAPPCVDGPERGPVLLEWVSPAGGPRFYPEHSETLVAVRRGTALFINTLVGGIRVEGWRHNTVRVQAGHLRNARLDVHREGDVLVVETHNGAGAPMPVDYVVQVPEWMPLKLSGMDTEISVLGVRSPISAASVRGNVLVRGGLGALQVSSVEGEVQVTDSQGELQAASLNNLVRLDRVTGTIDVESVNGDIRLREIESPDVDASSVNGTVLFSGPFQPRGRYRLASHNGRLLVGVPEDAGVEVSVATFNGAFRSAIPLPEGPRRAGRRFGFTLGSGGCTLDLESFQGLIQLLRPEELPPPHEPPVPAPPAARPNPEGR